MRVLMPRTLVEALEFRAGGRQITPVAGGTDLFVHWPLRLDLHDGAYVDLWHVGEIRSVRWTSDALELGGLTTYWDVVRDPAIRAEFPLLVDAARQVGAIQIQSRGTWAGNIANGSPAADGVPALMAYGAVVIIASLAGRREVPLDCFYLGYKEMDLRNDELIVAMRILRRRHDFERFIKIGSRRAQAIAKVGLALAHSDAGWRVVTASVAPTVRRCTSVEVLLDDGAPIDAPEDLLPALRADVTPIDDIRSTAEYRERVLARVLWDAISDTAHQVPR